jgi:hypothetical protein
VIISFSSMLKKNCPKNIIFERKMFPQNAQTVETTLKSIKTKLGKKVFTPSIPQLVQQYSKIIEATCWEPISRIENEEHQLLATSKTEALCNSLMKRYLETSDLTQNGTQHHSKPIFLFHQLVFVQTHFDFFLKEFLTSFNFLLFQFL